MIGAVRSGDWDHKQAESEWAYWIGSSCDLPADLTEPVVRALASSSRFAPSDLLSDLEYVTSLEAQVMSELGLTTRVPTELSGFIRYRLQQAVSTLPMHEEHVVWRRLRSSPGSDVIDGCARHLHEAMVAFQRQIQEETDDWIERLCDDGRSDSLRERGLLECEAE